MQRKRYGLLTVILMIGCCLLNQPIYAQAPSNETPKKVVTQDPGGFDSGSGGGTTTFDGVAGGGAAVPFDDQMGVLLLAVGVGYAHKKSQTNALLVRKPY